MAKYEIERNNYVEDKYVRPEVVQRLINYFVNHGGFSSMIDIDGHCRFKGLHRRKEYDRDEIMTDYEPAPSWYDLEVVVKQCEMEEFARVWIENGYFISRGVDSKWGTIQYIFGARPFTDYGFESVTSFTDKLRN